MCDNLFWFVSERSGTRVLGTAPAKEAARRNAQLLVAEGSDGIHCGRAARGEVTGCQDDTCEQNGDNREGQQVRGWDAI